VRVGGIKSRFLDCLQQLTGSVSKIAVRGLVISKIVILIIMVLFRDIIHFIQFQVC
jgi:hypothetical protein